jgi:hypothetical protein
MGGGGPVALGSLRIGDRGAHVYTGVPLATCFSGSTARGSLQS